MSELPMAWRKSNYDYNFSEDNMDTQVLENLIKDINDRLTAIGASASEERIKGLITTHLDGLLKDETFVRKMRFGSDSGSEKKLLGSKYARWGLNIADIEYLFELQEALRGQKKVDGYGVYEGPSEELRNTFNAISEAVFLPDDQVRAMDKKALDDMFPRIPLRWFNGKDRLLAKKGAWELTEVYQNAIRAMDTAETGYGLQLIGAQYVGDLWSVARDESKILARIDQFEMTAPVAYLPVEVDIPELLFVTESLTYNAANYATVKTGSNRVTVTAYKFVIHQMWSGELEEDSIIPFVPFLRRQAGYSMSFYGDSLCLNGDTTGTATGNINDDDEAPTATRHYLAFDGIRHAGLIDNTANQKDLAGPISLTALRDSKGRMVDAANKVDWGHPTNPNDLLFVADPETADRIALLDEVIEWYQQQGQPILNGQVARALGNPVIGTLVMPKTEADGHACKTAANNVKGQLSTFNVRGFKFGWRRRVKLETERIPATDQSRLVYSLRAGFGRFSGTGAVAGIEATDTIFDITL